MGLRDVIRKRLRGFLLLLAAVIAGMLSAEGWAIIRNLAGRRALDVMLGLHREGPTILLIPPMSQTKLREAATDSNADGKIDAWFVSIRPDDPPRFQVNIHDETGDGQPDYYTVYFANDCTSLGALDDDKDGRLDRITVSIGGFLQDQTRYKYHDYNLDGKFDTMSKMQGKEVLEHFILSHDVWTRVVAFDPWSSPMRAQVDVGGGQIVDFLFQNGEWKGPQDLEPESEAQEPLEGE